MSLNGLDDPKVYEAYHAALTEAGGWFLLKYVSRDAVEVLARGTGGASEARSAIAAFEETSPLYGFVLYRRRKVLIKYIPEETSRLLKARVAVHFGAVEEKFTPHDTTISITMADELSDAALTSACTLHTAAPSSSSSSASSRRNRLDEITEDAEDGQSTGDDAAVTPSRPATAVTTSRPATAVTSSRPATAASISASVEPVLVPETKARDTTAGAPELTKPKTAPQETKPVVEPTLEPKITPETPHVKSEYVSDEDKKPWETQPDTLPGQPLPNYRDSLKHYDSLFEHGPAPRTSSQTARPTYNDIYAEIEAQYNKSKVKLGPRPRPSLDGKRPKTSGSGELTTSRPKSSLPAGLRVANRKTAEPKRPKSRDSSVVPSIAFPPPPPIPEMPQSPLFPSYSHRPSSVRSMPSQSHRTNGTTPEKQRLMKALELRKKQMKVKEEQKMDQSPVGIQEQSAKSEQVSVIPDASSMEVATEDSNTAAKPEEEQANTQPKANDLPSDGYTAALDDMAASTTHDESGLEPTGSHVETDDLHSAASASSPTSASAQTQGSSCAPSTRPSSISEDDHQLPEEDLKLENTGQLDTSAESPHNEDEKESVESSPTVVPENESFMPSTASNDAAASSQTRSKRESIISQPSNGLGQPNETQTTDQKLESVDPSSSKRNSFLDIKEKRRAAISPIQIHLSADNSDAEYLSDDSFMEELQSATLEQAQPVSVSKSPSTSYFPRKSSISEVLTPQKSTFGLNKPGRLSPEQVGGRKLSGTWPPQATADPVALGKKINVSSGISQRIQALAMKSTSRESLRVSPTASPDVASSIVSQRKSSFFPATPSSENSPPGKTVSRLNRASFVPVAFSSTAPDRKSMIQQPIKNTDQAVYTVQQEPTKPESVQVTARIVRDPRVQKPTLAMPTESTPLGLHQSPIIIDHQKSASTRPSSSRSKHSPSKIEPASPSSNPPRSSSESSWRSFGRRMSESKAGGLPRSQSSHSLEVREEKQEENKKEKKDSRTTKLFKRMSTMSSMSRKSQGTIPNVNELEHPSLSLPALPSLREPPPAVQVGDLNIQFPDTLLWKRRWVEIDASGNLVLSLSKSNEQSKGITKRFHLSEFRKPYTPDQDRQELPNSVILDFVDGRTLQCACETYVAQCQIIQILREAHEAWIAYNQFQ
ncbi:hypothetical protein K504DRAFT_387454 [Pleomassaria siparia CBS 279.74]|uniref:ADF-H domain-containing protein n=1 Tax=Pleomassaria siparia CBS 279.74 TaxID=1314801 RepID=A0A6G1K0K6_9PLEO|nr:hypothetical protein K504DRAFT_387454 [Pleomassaria siparia CBS 279.74]